MEGRAGKRKGFYISYFTQVAVEVEGVKGHYILPELNKQVTMR